jgi:hypothetical protein
MPASHRPVRAIRYWNQSILFPPQYRSRASRAGKQSPGAHFAPQANTTSRLMASATSFGRMTTTGPGQPHTRSFKSGTKRRNSQTVGLVPCPAPQMVSREAPASAWSRRRRVRHAWIFQGPKRPAPLQLASTNLPGKNPAAQLDGGRLVQYIAAVIVTRPDGNNDVEAVWAIHEVGYCGGLRRELRHDRLALPQFSCHRGTCEQGHPQ